MQCLPLNNLRPGMIVGRNITIADGSVLLTAGAVLTRRYVDRLHRLGIPRVFIWNKHTADLKISGPVKDTTRLKAVKTIRLLLNSLNTDVDRKTNINKELSQITDIVDGILADILSSGKLILDFFEFNSSDDYTFHHSVNVCIMAILVGKKEGLAKDKLQELGLAAILYDIGKALVPGNILNKRGSLNLDEYWRMKKHTSLGYELLCSTNGITAPIARVALQHHERFDGRGYPNFLEGRTISYYARLVAICDVYDALISSRVYRPRYLPHHALEYILGGGGTHFDYDLVQTFTTCVPMYPLGSMVYLNSSQFGVVTEVFPGQLSSRPVVRILKDENSCTLLKPYDLDLRQHPQILITSVL